LISFVVQGPTRYKSECPFGVKVGETVVYPEQTFTSQDCVDSLREFYPDCEIIVSCTTGDADVLTDIDKLVYVTDDMLESEDNINRQILSSQAVKHASNDTVCKIRSDMVALAPRLLPYIESKIKNRRLDSHKMFDEYVIISNWSTDKDHYYHPADFLFLGTKKDLQSIFDIPQRLDREWKVGPEQYIGLRCMENYDLGKYIDYEWLENHGSNNTHTGQNVPPKDFYIENWWKVFYSNYYVVDLGIQSGIMSKKYPERVTTNPNLINNKEWHRGYEEYIK
jgi:hypothetical protein